MTRVRRGEDGAATVLALAMVGLLVSVAVAAVGVVGVVAAHRRAQAAADLAALAGAAALSEGRDPCVRAAELARRNDAVLRRCQVAGWNVRVAVETTWELPGRPMTLEGRSHAGPVFNAPAS